MNSRFRYVSANSLLQVLCICISFLATKSPAALRTWSGATGDELASTPGNWGGTAPQTGDDIVLNSTSHSNMTWNMTNLVIGSWTQSDYQGTVTVATVYDPTGFTNLNITGDCVISNGVWTHPINNGNNSAAQTYRLCVNIGGDLVVGPDAAILAEAVGFSQGYAKAGHGGRAYGISSSASYRCPGGEIYGSVITPTNVGHGGFSRGGGAVRMTITGRTRIDGAVSANGGDSTYYSGAGGAVWIVSGQFDGTGTVSANGGNITGHSSAGGGRVAIVLTGPGQDFTGFSGTVSAYGGRIGAGPMRAGAGTVYLQNGDDLPGNGELVVDNDGSVIEYGAFPNYYINTCLGDKYPVSYEFSRITITNNGVLILGSNVTLVATNTLINGDPSSEDDGIQIVGGSFIVPDNFTYSNFFICIARYWESFSHLDGGIVYDTTPIFQPSTSLTIDNDAILYIDQLHTMTNTLTVKSGGMLSQTHNPVHASLHQREEHKIMLDLRGNLVIEAGGMADVSDKGFGDDAPGTHDVNNCGGSYGGLGDGGLSCYGSIVAPTNLGSGGRGSSASLGGGAMILNVTGVISNNGAILANSGDSSTRTGSGGSIQVVAGTITGTGPIQANSATNVTGSNPGGGGRISLTLTNSGAGFAGYAGSITAYGGRKPAGTSGGAGTVYLREAGQGPQEGLLLIDNDGLQCIATEISQSVLDTVVGDVTIQGSACLLLNTNQVLTVNGDWNNTSCFTGYTDSVVSFTGPPNSTSTVAGTTTFSGLFCTNTPKTLLFTAGSASAIASYGRLVLMGSASDDLVLRSTADNNAWDLEVDPAAEQVVANVDVRDSDAGGGAEVTAVNSTDSGSNTNWRFVTVVGSETNRWTGASSTVWSARENWNLDRSPSETDIIVVPAGCPHYPALDADRTVNCLQIDSNAFLELANRNLTVTNELTVRGALIASGAETITLARNADLSDAVFTPAFSTVVLNGETDQSFNPGELTYYKITVLNQSGTVHFRGGMEATELRCEAPSGTRNLCFEEGASFALYDLVLSGSTVAPNIFLRSSSADRKWNLNVSGYRSVCGVDVRDSDASGGLTIPASHSQDSSHNINWDFAPALAVWVGGTSESFHDADNWNPTGVPGASSRALVESANPMIITSAVALLDLTVGGGANAATARVDSALTVAENIMILTNGTLLLNRPSTTGEGLFVEASGTLSHSPNTTSEVNKIELTVGGDAMISVGGNIDVTAKGYKEGYGPGYSHPSASYGGRGGNGYSGSIMSTGRCYGSISAPTNLGSGGSSYVGEPGGGAIILRVSGELRHDGAMCANAKDGGGNRGAGGTVFLKCDSMSGTGTIQAHGGCCTVHSPGGGGRIALVVTNKSTGFYRFTGNATAYSGRKLPANTSAGGAGAGTIYCETARDGAGYGKVTIDNADYTTTRVTEVPPLYAPTGETARIAFMVTNNGTLWLSDDYTVGDIFLTNTTSILDLNTNILHVNAFEHDIGTGAVTNYGQIIWYPDAAGTVFMGW